MATATEHRIMIACPVGAKLTALVAWLQANINPNDVDATLGPPCNASGLSTDPATHRWYCGAYTDAQCKAIMLKLCNLTGVVTPTNAQWNGWTRAEKKAWLVSVRDAMWTSFGVVVHLCDNTATFDDFRAILLIRSLKPALKVTP